MFDYINYYKLFNSRTASRYQKEYTQLLWIANEMKPHKGPKEARMRYAKSVAQLLTACVEMEAKWNTEYFTTASREQLRKDQNTLYGDLARSRYGKTILNPAFAAKVLGREEGPLLAAAAAQMRENIRYAYRHMQFAMHWNHELFLDLFQLLNQDGPVSAEEIRSLMEEHALRSIPEKQGLKLHEIFGFEDIYRRDLIETLDWTDPLNLYAMGEPVSETEWKLSTYMASLPDETIQQMASAFVQGFRKGFLRNGKDLMGRSTVGIEYPLGMERMIREALPMFRQEMRYIPFVRGVHTSWSNQQYTFDHRFDMAAYATPLYFDRMLEAMETMVENNREMIQAYGGPAIVSSFGEPPFKPQIKKDCLALTEEQTALYNTYRIKERMLLTRYASPEYTSFTMIAFPLPSIGEPFEEIFQETIRINTLPETRYEQAQQAMIDAMDQGTAVQILGAEGNETDLTIALHPVRDPRHTSFFNCLADVNIPVGEVYTTPLLAGTNGCLHLKTAYLDGLRYEDLKLTFTEGYVTAYSCVQGESEETGRKYVEESLLFPHRTLPIGEFAIGTNTAAFSMARRYGIAELLPMLIAEKTGPHIALGDPCFAREEDRTIYNTVSRKEIIAKENERTAGRLEEPENAYTGRHIDIVIPFDEIQLIAVRAESGFMTDIIRDGRFVLRGTDIFNEDLEV